MIRRRCVLIQVVLERLCELFQCVHEALLRGLVLGVVARDFRGCDKRRNKRSEFFGLIKTYVRIHNEILMTYEFA